MRVVRLLSFLLGLSVAASGCDRNPFDESQRPRVTVTRSGSVAVFSWQPTGAQLVRVYRGATAGDGYGDRLVWSVGATSKNSIASGVTYGVVPVGGANDVAPQALLAGDTYTVEVTRADPKGKGEGFTGNSNRYVGTATFVASSP